MPPEASAEAVKAAFASYDTEVAFEEDEFAMFVRGIKHGDIESAIADISGAQWMHMYE